jgi:methylmalonyl-CoA/ethylmalonyl-CoA epimerase
LSLRIGIFDHIAVAVRNLAKAREFYEACWAVVSCTSWSDPDKGYKLCKIELYWVAIELLEPLGADSFLHGYLAKHGDGLHHIAFNIPGSKWEAERIREHGVAVVEDTDTAERHDALFTQQS